MPKFTTLLGIRVTCEAGDAEEAAAKARSYLRRHSNGVIGLDNVVTLKTIQRHTKQEIPIEADPEPTPPMFETPEYSDLVSEDDWNPDIRSGAL